jgi:hypothetical protein
MGRRNQARRREPGAMNLSPSFWPALALVVIGLILLFFVGWVGIVLGIIAIVAGFVVLTRGRSRTSRTGTRY